MMIANIKKITLLVIISAGFLLARDAWAGPPKDARPLKILFVGNSLTYVNDLPGLVQKVARARDHNVLVETYAPGGYTFEQDVTDNKLMLLIQEKPWDVVVLQEQSQRPALSHHEVEDYVYPNAKILVETIRGRHPQTQVIFFETMGMRNGDPESIPVAKEMGTYEGMQARLNAAYEKMASDNNALLAPVGAAWQDFRRQYPAVDLYTDDTHPNALGSYLAACVIYQKIFGESAVGLMIPSNVDQANGAAVQKLVSDLKDK